MNGFEIRKVENGIEVEGYANVTGSKSYTLKDKNGFYFKERITDKAFEKALNRAYKEERNILFLNEHDAREVMAETRDNSLSLEVDNIGLKVKAKVTNPKYFDKLKNGTQMSFGFRCLKDNIKPVNKLIAEEERVNYKEPIPDYTREVEDLELIEVTATDNPAYGKSQIREKRSLGDDVEYRTLTIKFEDKELARERERFEFAKSLTLHIR